MTKKWGLTFSIPSNLVKMNWNEEGLKWDQLFTVDTRWNIGETGDMYIGK